MARKPETAAVAMPQQEGIPAATRGQELGDLHEGGPEGDGGGQEEAEPRRLRAGEAQEQGGADGRPGAGDARARWPRLGDADEERVAWSHLSSRRVAGAAVGDEEAPGPAGPCRRPRAAGARKRVSAQSSRSRPATAPGTEARASRHRVRASGSSKGRPRRRHRTPRRAGAASRRRRRHHGEQRPEVQGHVERQAVVGPAQEPGHHDQVARAADGQELAQPLNQAEDDGLQRRHRPPARWTSPTARLPSPTLPASLPLRPTPTRRSSLHGIFRLRQRSRHPRRRGPGLHPRQRLHLRRRASTRRCGPTADGRSPSAATSRACATSAGRLGFAIPAGDDALAATLERCSSGRGNPESFIRLIVTRGVGDISYHFERVKGPTVVMAVKPFEGFPGVRTTRRASPWPWSASAATTRRPSTPRSSRTTC